MDFADHILVASDFSDLSDRAIDAAAVLAKQLGAKVTLIHSFDPDPLIPPGAIPRPQEFREKITKEMTDAVTEKLEALRAERLASADVEIAVLTHKSAATAITEHAKKIGADLIILGTTGRTGLAHLLIGSVAERVVRHAHCAVLAVRIPKD